MICRQCLQRASALRPRIPPQSQPAPTLRPAVIRPFSSTLVSRSAAPAPSPASDASSQPPPPPKFGTVDAAEGGGAAAKAPLSSCAEGSVLVGLNYFKNRTDPVALADHEYPEWLWRCLEVSKKVSDEDAEDAGDEFSKSKKQRRLAMKRQRAYEARLLAEGNIEALAPKIPLQHQSINLPGNEENTPEGALKAREAREELRRAMRRDRKFKIKESNYLKSM
ncbi:mitochondrial ribosomal protein L37-domain-containing protein [Camillea tinctor]|nr:mitochondrial ribosomal protein L37-domain-containing protein [Camillea tinctor]